MNVGHFSYLLEGRKPQVSKVASDRLESFAKIATKRSLEGGGSLNDVITKLAKENDLNANQIARVCEMANIATHQALWPKTAQKEKLSFPLADAKVVLASCGCGGGEAEAPAPSMDADYAGPPTAIPRPGPSLASLMGVDPGAVHNGLAGPNDRQRIIVVLQKQASERRDLTDRTLLLGMELESLEKRAFELVKQTVLGGATMRDVLVASVIAGHAKLAKELLPAFEKRLIADTHGDVRSRLIKQAIAPVADDLISENLGNTTIINGAHPVLVSLDTIQRKTDEIKNGLRGIVRVDDEIKINNQKLRDL
ncbi:MAG: hypothetical protein KBF21_07630 [Thermoanaerobaculia bacterium]|nr:hypothetical protein [Thermoanaerobaculia bacterium]